MTKGDDIVMDRITQFALADKDFIKYVNDILSDVEYMKLEKFRHHFNSTRLDHCVHVAYSCYLATLKSKYQFKRSLIRGALLHDFFLYDYRKEKAWKKHWLHGLYHPNVSLNNAIGRFKLDDIERSVISHHMFPLTIIPPANRAAWYVIFYDKYWAVKECIKHNDFTKDIIHIRKRLLKFA